MSITKQKAPPKIGDAIDYSFYIVVDELLIVLHIMVILQLLFYRLYTFHKMKVGRTGTQKKMTGRFKVYCALT